jgi:anti-sigma regulatory factor (Ser/Thr protein kinase)
MTSPDQISGPILMEVPSDPAAMFLVRCLVERLAQRLCFSEEEVVRMTLAVDEACTNVIRHAYGNRSDQRILLRFLVLQDRLEVQVKDYGASPDPEALRPRDLNEVRPGGLGLHFIRKAMDEVHYEVPGEGGCVLRLIKYRKPREGETP